MKREWICGLNKGANRESPTHETLGNLIGKQQQLNLHTGYREQSMFTADSRDGRLRRIKIDVKASFKDARAQDEVQS